MRVEIGELKIGLVQREPGVCHRNAEVTSKVCVSELNVGVVRNVNTGIRNPIEREIELAVAPLRNSRRDPAEISGRNGIGAQTQTKVVGIDVVAAATRESACRQRRGGRSPPQRVSVECEITCK